MRTAPSRHREGKPYLLQVFPRDRHGIRHKQSSIHYVTAITVALEEHLKTR
jgi:dipeptidyl aminopeptidase/acylaminoacyl peptidase